MKKVFFLALGAAMFTACNEASNSNTPAGDSTVTTTSSNTPDSTVQSQAIETAQAPAAITYTDGDVIKKDGKVVVYKNGEWVVVDKEIKLSNGVVVLPNGTVKGKDGKTIELEEGVHVDKTGNFFDKAGVAISNAWDATKEGVSNAANTVADKATDAAQATKEGVKNAANKVSDKAKDVVDQIKH